METFAKKLCQTQHFQSPQRATWCLRTDLPWKLLFAGANFRCLTWFSKNGPNFKGSEALGPAKCWWWKQLLKEISFLRKEGSDDYLGIAVVQHQPFTDGFMVSVSGGSPNPEKWVPVFLLRSSAVKMSHEQIHSASNKFDTNFKHIYRTQTARVLFLFLIKHVVTCRLDTWCFVC